MSGDGHSFVELADQWLAAYAMNFSQAPGPNLFILGHCVEAYCKAALSFSIKEHGAIRTFDHDIGRMLTILQSDCGILQEFVLKESAKKRYLFVCPVPIESMNDPEYYHFVAHQELYWVSNFQKNLKYLGTPGKGMPNQFSLMVLGRNPYWVPFLRELRGYCLERQGFETLARRTYLETIQYPPASSTFIGQVLG